MAICETSWKCRATIGPIGATTITSARSSGTDMTGCSTVLQSGGAACQCYTDTTVYQLLQTEQAVQCTDTFMMTLGNCNGLGQFIWLIGWMVSVVKLVKWLGCKNQVVRMIYQILDRM